MSAAPATAAAGRSRCCRRQDGAAIIEPNRVFELLAPWVGPDDVALERTALYTFHSRVASRWRDRRMSASIPSLPSAWAA